MSVRINGPVSYEHLTQMYSQACNELEAWQRGDKLRARVATLEAALRNIVTQAHVDYETRDDYGTGAPNICALCTMGLDFHSKDCLVGIAKAALAPATEAKEPVNLHGRNRCETCGTLYRPGERHGCANTGRCGR